MSGSKVVLVYHRINEPTYDYNRITVSSRMFSAHLDYLKARFRILPLNDLLSYGGDEDALAITFDDGYKDFYSNAYPIIKLNKIPVTLFISTQNIGSNREMWMSELLRVLFNHEPYVEQLHLRLFSQLIDLPLKSLKDRNDAYTFLRYCFMCMSMHDREHILSDIRVQLGISETARDEYMLMDEDEIRIVANDSLVEIGAHTVSHPSLAKLNTEEKREEICVSIQFLGELIGKDLKLFSYPFGSTLDYDEESKDILLSSGINYAFTVENRQLKHDDDPFTLPRAYIYNWGVDGLKAFMDMLISGESNTKPSNRECGCHTDLSNLHPDDKVVIWGIGKNAKKIYDLVKCKCRIEAFVEGDSHTCDKLFDIPVWHIEDVSKFCKDLIVIVKNSHDVEIIKKLYDMSIYNFMWIR